MPHVIEIPESTFKRLQALANPLIDTTSSVIDRIVEHYERTRPGTTNGPTSGTNLHSLRDFDPRNPPSLKHAKLLKAAFASEEIDRPNWSELARKSLEIALATVNNISEVRRFSGANIVKGIKTDEGYAPLGTLGVSVQGVDAHGAWRIAYRIARKLNCSIEVDFEWRDKEEAAYPGERARMMWQATDNGSPQA